MSFNPLAARTVAELIRHLPANPSVIELGNQTFKASDDILKAVIAGFNGKPGAVDIEAIRSLIGKTKEEAAASTEFFYRALGFKSYKAIDVNDRYGSVMMDLNRDLRADYGFTETFDLVTNNGTGEHCFNQHAIFKNMHELTKLGGVMLHIMPMNWVNHGFFNYNPVLYADVAAANGYEILTLRLDSRWGMGIDLNPAPPVKRTRLERFLSRWKTPEKKAKKKEPTVYELLKLNDTKGVRKILVVAALKKKIDAPFVIPIQGKYKNAVQSPEIQRRYGAQISDGGIPKLMSVFSKAAAADVVMEPFPHLIVKNAIDPELYERLAAEWPEPEVLMGAHAPGNNKKHFYPARKSLKDERVSPLWKAFIRHHLTPEFHREAMRVFGPAVRKLYPDLEQRLGKKLEDLRTGLRRTDPDAELEMDCQFAINSPVTERPSSVRGPHVDGPSTLFQGLLYFREDGDDAGGELELYRFKKDADLSRFQHKIVDPALVEHAATVPYEKNTLIAFVNSESSLHGVSPRNVTAHIRKYFDVLSDLRIPLYDLKEAAGARSATTDEY